MRATWFLFIAAAFAIVILAGSARATNTGTLAITADTTWTLEGSPYNVTGTVTVSNGATLTVEPGVTIRFPSTYRLHVGSPNAAAGTRVGHLVLDGTEASPILVQGGTIELDGWNGAAGPSFVRNTTFNASTGYALEAHTFSTLEIHGSTFLNPATAGAYLSASSPLVAGSSFLGGPYALYSPDWQAAPSLQGNTFSGQTNRYARLGIASVLDANTFTGSGTAVQLFGGNRWYDVDVTLRAEPVTYHLFQWFGVRNGRTLTIEPGFTALGNDDFSVQIGDASSGTPALRPAAFVAEGTEAQPITIGSLSGASSPSWDGFSLNGYNNAARESVVRNATLARASGNALYAHTWHNLTLDNVTFENASSYGLYLESASPTIRSSRFYGSPHGIYASSWTSQPAILGSAFWGQTTRHARLGLGSHLDGNTFTGSGTAVDLLGGNRWYDVDVTLRHEPVTFYLYQWFGVRNDRTLTIEPGFTALGNDDFSVQVGDASSGTPSLRPGRAMILGTSEAPITIGSLAGSTTASWDGFSFNGYNGAARASEIRNATLRQASSNALYAHTWSSLVVDNVTFDRASSYAVYLESSSPTIVGTTFLGAPHGIYASGWTSHPTVLASRFENQTTRHARVGLTSHLEGLTFGGTGTAIELMAGNRWVDETDVVLRNVGVPYDLYQWLGLRLDRTLVVEPGVTVRANSDATVYVGEPGTQGTAGLRAAYGSYSLNATAYSFRPGTAGSGCANNGPDMRGYVCESIPYTWSNISTTGTSSGVQCDDCVSAAIPIGFPFAFYGATYSNVYVSSNGFLAFSPGQGAGCCSGQALPTASAPNHLVAGYWEDLHPGVAGTVKHQTVGDAPNRQLIVQWTGVAHYSSNSFFSTFQIVLDEATGAIEVRLEDVRSDGGTHVTGIESLPLPEFPRGRVVAEGTQASPIVFTSLSGSNTWPGFRFQGTSGGASADTILRNVTLARSSSHAAQFTSWSPGTFDNMTFGPAASNVLYLSSSSPTFRNTLVTGSATHNVYLTSSSPAFLGGSIESAAAYGVYSDSSSSPSFDGTTLRLNAQRPLRVPLDTDLRTVTFTSNGIQEIEYAPRDLVSSFSLAPSYDSQSGVRLPGIVMGTFTILNQATLTIEPDVRILVGDAQHVNVGGCCSNPSSRGNLTILGTAEQPVYIGSRSGSATNGWYGFYFRGDYAAGTSLVRNATVAFSRDDGLETYHYGALTLDNVTFDRNARHGIQLVGGTTSLVHPLVTRSGSHGAYLSTATVTMRGGTIENSNGYGIWANDAGGALTVLGTAVQNSTQRPIKARLTDTLVATLTNNTIREIEHHGVDVTSAHTLAPHYDAGDGQRYTNVVLNTFSIRNQATWTIAPDVRLLVGDAQHINVGSCCSNPSSRGNITILGTAEQPVYVGSRSGSTTNGWYGFYLRGDYAAGTSVLRNVTIAFSRDDGLETYHYGALTLDNVTADRNARHGVALVGSGTNTIVHPLLTRSGSHGLHLSSASATLRGGTIGDSNGYGIWANDAGSSVTVLGTAIQNSAQRPIRARITDTLAATLSNNTIREIEHHGVDVTNDGTLAPHYDAGDGQRYTNVVLSTFSIRNQATWTIAPDVRLLVGDAQHINVGSCCSNPSSRGNITILGTADQPVYVGSRSGSTTNGWYGFYLRGDYAAGTSVLRNVTVAFSRDDGIDTYHYGSLTLDNVTADRNARHGIAITGGPSTALRNVVSIGSGTHGAYFSTSSPVWNEGGVTGSGGTGIHFNGCGMGTLADLTIQGATGYGLYSDGTCGGAHMERIHFAQPTGRPFRNRLDATMRDLTATSPGVPEVELWAMTISGARTLTLEPVLDASTGAAFRTVVLGAFTVNGGAVLELAPGLELRFRANEYVNLGSSSSSRGTLLSRGTRDRPINVSGTSSAIGAWGSPSYGGFLFEWTGLNRLENTTIDGSNINGIRVHNGQVVVLDNVSIQRTAGSGAFLNSGGSRAWINASNLTRNNADGVYVENGGILDMARSNASHNGANGVNVRAATVTISGSTFMENGRSGVNATGSNPALSVSGSYLIRNAHVGVDLAATTGSTIVDNAFIENVQAQARATAWNRWNVTPTPGRNIAYGPFLGGNSWSDYAGEDTDADGLGDTLVPYNAGLGPGADFHPVMGNLYADFTVAVPDVVNLPHELVFADASRGGFSPPDQWIWDMGDGAQYTTSGVTHTYAADGSYAVQLTVANPHGQVSQVTKTVHADSVAPVTTAFVNGTAGLAGWITSAVNVTLNATDDRSGVNRTLHSLDGGPLTVYTVKIPVTSNGHHNLSYHSIDRNGNVEAVKTATFRIDRTLPVAGNATLVGSAGNAGWFVSDVAATLAASDNVSGVARIDFGIDAPPGTTYAGPVVFEEDGVRLLRYRAFDEAGLASAERNVTVRRDATAPEVAVAQTGALGGGGFWLGPVTINATATDATSGLASLTYRVDGGNETAVNGTFVVTGHGVHQVNVTATDVAGNVNATTHVLVQIDLLPPVSEHHFEGTLGANGVYVSPVNVTFTGNDSISGIDRFVYSLDDGPNTTYTGPVPLSINGQHRLVYRAIDVAGNAETIHEVVVVLDLEAPTTSLNLTGAAGQNGWFLSNVTAELTVDDPSSLDEILYRLDGSDPASYVSPFLIAGEGVHNLSYYAVSIGGLVEETQTRAVRIDLAPPALGATLDGTPGLAGWFVSPVNVKLLPTDAASGIATTLVGLDGAPLATYTGPVPAGTTGEHHVDGRTTDVSGRSTDLATVTFRLDLDDPIASLALAPAAPDGANGWYVTSPTVTITATDVGAGVDHVLLSIDGGPEAIVAGPFALGEGTHALSYRAVDLAGRAEPVRTTIVRVDLTPPTLDETFVGTAGLAGWYTSPVNVTLAPADATSGVASIFASVNGAPETAVTGPVPLVHTRTHTVAWRAVDAAGLAANRTLVVKVDRFAPTTTPSLTPLPNGFAWRNQIVTATLSATDQPGLGSGVASIESGLDGAPLAAYTGPFTIGEGFHNLSFRGIDVAGLVNTTTTQPVNVDLTPPSVTHAMRPPDQGGWHLASVPVNFTASDALSGVRFVEWWVDQGAHTNLTGRTMTLTQEGAHVLRFRARDFADVLSATTEVPFGLDTLPPTITHGFGGALPGGSNRSVSWYRVPVNLSLVASDLGSGVAETRYVLDGGPPQGYAGPLAFTGEGSHNLSAWALDHVGRQSTTLVVPAFGVDLTPPTTTPTIEGSLDPADGVYKTTVNVSLLAEDALSGVAPGLLRVNNGSGWVAYTGAIEYSVSGSYTLLYQATDVAGNAEPVRELAFSVFVDTTPPVTMLDPAPSGWFGGRVDVLLRATDVQSSVHALLVRVDGGPLQEILGNTTTIPLSAEGVHVVEYAAIDVAGNLELLRNATYRIDLTPPTLSLDESYTQGNNGWIRSAASLTPIAEDALSGIPQDAVRARVNGVERAVDGALVLDRSGFYNVTFWATDAAGLVSDVVAWAGRIDVGPPVPNVVVVGPQGLGGWHKGNVSVLLAATDDLSEVDRIEYSWDNGSFSPYPGSAFSFTQEGVHWLQVRVLDLAGNLAITPGQTVGIDRTRPLVSTALAGEPGFAGWFVSPVTATTTVEDLGATPETIPSGIHNFSRIVDSGANASVPVPSVVAFATSGVHTLSGYALDLALNGARESLVVPVDLEDPTLDRSFDGPAGLDGWWRGPVTLTATSVDPTSGPAPPLLDGVPLLAPVTFADDGVRAIVLEPVDVAGRIGAVESLDVKIDQTPPEPLSAVAGEAPGLHGWFRGNTTVSLGMSDATSGSGAIRFRVDNGSLQTYAGPFNLSAGGIRAIDWIAFDVAGNPTEQTLLVKIDNDVPVANASILGDVGNNSWFTSAVTIALDASDPTSGVLSIEYRIDGGVWTPYTGNVTLDVEGRHTLEYRAFDGSGFPSITYYHEILIDLTTPIVDIHLENTLFIEFDGKLYIRGTLCIEVSGLDVLSGLNDLYLKITGVITELIRIELEVGLHCFDLDGSGAGGGGGCLMCAIARDLAGNEIAECLDGVYDPSGPAVDIVRPFVGALNLQNASIPLFSTAFSHGATIEDPGVSITVDSPEGKKQVGGSTRVSGNNGTLAQTTLVAGTRVPVWVSATDGLSPISRVELRVDDVVVGTSNRTENVTFQYAVLAPKSRDVFYGEPELGLPPEPASNATPDGNEHSLHVLNVTMPVYVFYLDTLRLPAGDHNLTARAWDIPGNLAKVTQLVGYVSPAAGNATMDVLEEASRDRSTLKGETPREASGAFPLDTWNQVPDEDVPGLPEPARGRLETLFTAARIVARLYDFLLVDNYAFLDRTVVREVEAYETVDAAIASLPAPLPPVVFAGAFVTLAPAHSDQVTSLLPEGLPLPDFGGEEE